MWRRKRQSTGFESRNYKFSVALQELPLAGTLHSAPKNSWKRRFYLPTSGSGVLGSQVQRWIQGHLYS